MSLKVWLPLDGTVENKGTDNAVVTNSGATVNTSGKIGSCYSFDGSDDYISVNDSALYNVFKGGTQPFSIAMWVYHGDSTRAILFGDYGLIGAISFNIELTTSHTVRFYWGANPDYDTTINVGASTWTHIALVYNGETLKSYKDGVLVNTRNGALVALSKTSGVFYLGRDNRTGTTVLNGRLNDVRIYDHCLSVAEVHELSQGLVLHYKLDGHIKNWLVNSLPTNSTSNWGVVGTDWTRAIVANDFSPSGYVVRQTYNGTGNTSGGVYHSCADMSLIENGSTYTLSCWARASKDCIVQFRNESSSVPNTTLTTAWKHISVTGTINTGATYKSNTLYVSSSTVASGMWVESCQWKFELGDKATEWTPHPTEALYTALGYDSDIITDSSGYGRHGTVSEALVSEQQTPKYRSCVHFNATSKYIKCGAIATIGFANSYSFSWWSKVPSWSSLMNWGFSDGIRLNGIYNGTLWNTGDGSNNPLYTPGTTTQVTAPTTNVWHHFVMTGDGTTCRVYKDGVLWATAKTYKAISGSQIYINGWDTSTTYSYSNLSVSDFRVYATTLSADDILALYKTEAKIPSHSDIHAYAFNEAGSRELLNGVVWTDSYSTHANIPSVNLTNGEYVLTGKQSIGSPYISISPSGHTYVYDIDVSTDSGNSFYIGFERYDKDKTSRSNNACVYLSGLSGDTSARIHQHYSGTVDLSTDGVNPCAFIALRVLNDWNSPNSRKATVHYISLREVSTAQTPTIGNNGVFTVDELKERQKAAFFKNGFVESTEFIEM